MTVFLIQGSFLNFSLRFSAFSRTRWSLTISLKPTGKEGVGAGHGNRHGYPQSASVSTILGFGQRDMEALHSEHEKATTVHGQNKNWLKTSKNLPVDERSRQNAQFQKNEATCQTNRPIIKKLQRLFPNKVVYRSESTNIPQGSTMSLLAMVRVSRRKGKARTNHEHYSPQKRKYR